VGIPDSPHLVTGLLVRWGAGDESALQELVPLVHHELHHIARRYMAAENAGHTLQATALINEAYVRLVGGNAIALHDRAHFLAVAARIMRRILVDRARARRSQKRGGLDARVTFHEDLNVSDSSSEDFVRLDDALEALAKFDERKSRVIELRFFGGLTVEETASVLKVSEDTVMRDWRLAKVWLHREMRGERQDGA
jgi:RNA polymerase sigma factor (TIGR02999 family)